jgi:hypothetical protein
VTLARCPFKGCAIRYHWGRDRLCPEHETDTTSWPGRLNAMQELMDAPDNSLTKDQDDHAALLVHTFSNQVVT